MKRPSYRRHLVGRRFGRLVVVSRFKGSYWNCDCDCGNKSTPCSSDLAAGKSKSCGCLRLEACRRVVQFSAMPEYKVWAGMITRCTNANFDGYAGYGGRGIKVCDAWKNSFLAFLSDMRHRPTPKHTLERIDNDGDYCPSNTRWATKIEQANNTRRNVLIEYRGQRMTIPQAARLAGVVSSDCARQRVCSGWPINLAFETPLMEKFARRPQ